MKIVEKTELMNASEMDRTLIRMAYEIVERNNGVENLALIGVVRRGFYLAQRLAMNISKVEPRGVEIGKLDINLYRDDLSTVAERPVVQNTEIPFSIVDRNLVIVDDVLYTGRTVRSALDALFEKGRPRRVHLGVLIDRGHRELPIEAQFIGKHVPTTDREIIEVKLREVDGMEKVLLVERVDD
ncbi:MAG: bifunctional pyr operon transcriptional regulator/uracil phosphoribosyltransferase PyrR [Acidobacteriia bacterium]|nr:bifunctional pyr operon transcriptional regulator/uracil phosphoribosyltransferase PyrR [Terriglobia bacterium]